MKRTKALLLAIAILLALAAIAAGWFFGMRGGDTATPAQPTGPVTVVDGVTIVQVDPAVQRRSGIATEPAKAVGVEASRKQLAVPGVVIDLQPLIAWRSRVVAGRAQQSAAQSQVDASDQELQRTRALYADAQNASRKALEAAQAAQARDRAQLDAAAASVRAIEEEGRLQFGPALTASGETKRQVSEALLGRRESLVAVAIAPGLAPPSRLDIEAPGRQTLAGTWLSAAAAADPRLGAGLQLYRVPAFLPANTAVTAYLGADVSGVLVPLPAVIWQAGQPWAYLRRDRSHFARTALLEAKETREGFVVPHAIRPGEEVVTQGAQLLLSQEQLPPPGGSGCRDPECD